MSVTYVAYIDESGDTGLDLVKKPDDPRGATEWLVLAAFVVKVEHDSKMVAWTQDVQSDFTSKRSDLHFNKLLDFKKGLVCAALAKKDCKCFVVMSNKKNIEKYRNSRLDDGNKAWIYWFLSRLLLERVTEYCEGQTPQERRGTDKVRIIFSRRAALPMRILRPTSRGFIGRAALTRLSSSTKTLSGQSSTGRKSASLTIRNVQGCSLLTL
jgi:hypothetical protein